ncbi:hypothetical protein GQ44DRAFT_745675 [Phaeosphaeriaceae sp. PMI808]|nr:hypothetical protein GQ44DRAFT_745675 [Phaeosphaeriaceae sp. PMI808]
MSSDGQDRQNLLVGVSTALTTISVIIVSLRLYTRIFVLNNIKKDDYAMIVALVFTLGYLACIFVLRANGTGFSGRVLTLDQMTNIFKVTYVIEMIYYIAVNAIKISIVCFYLRIAVQRTFELLCLGTIYFLCTFCAICIIVIATQCMPIQNSANIVIDIWILILPIKVLLSIQRPVREKTALIAIFALGAFSCIASIIRIYSVYLFTSSKDPFVDGVHINTWSVIEINVGIWCASIPSLKPLFSKAQRERRGKKRTGYQYHGIFGILKDQSESVPFVF